MRKGMLLLVGVAVFMTCHALAEDAQRTAGDPRPWHVENVSRLPFARPGAVEASPQEGAEKYLHIRVDFDRVPDAAKKHQFQVINARGEEIGQLWGWNDRESLVIFEGQWASLAGLYLEGLDHREPLFAVRAAEPQRPVVPVQPDIVERPRVRTDEYPTPVYGPRRVVVDEPDRVVHYDRDRIVYGGPDRVIHHGGERHIHHGGSDRVVHHHSGGGTRHVHSGGGGTTHVHHGGGSGGGPGAAAGGGSGCGAGSGAACPAGSGCAACEAAAGDGSGSGCGAAPGTTCPAGSGCPVCEGSEPRDDLGDAIAMGPGEGPGAGPGPAPGTAPDVGEGTAMSPGEGPGPGTADCGEGQPATCPDCPEGSAPGEGPSPGEGSAPGEGPGPGPADSEEGQPATCPDCPEEGSEPGQGPAPGEGPAVGPGAGPGYGPGEGPAEGPGGPGNPEGPGGPDGGPMNIGPQRVGPRVVGPRVIRPDVDMPTYRDPRTFYDPRQIYDPELRYDPRVNFRDRQPGGPGGSPGSGGPGRYGELARAGLKPELPKPEAPPAFVLYVAAGEENEPGKVYQVDEHGRVLGWVNLPFAPSSIDLHREHGLVVTLPRDGGRVMYIDDTGKSSTLLEKEKNLVHPVSVGVRGNSDTIVVADNIADSLMATSTGGITPKEYRRFEGQKWHAQDMSVAVTRDGDVLFGTNGDKGVYRFSGNPSESDRKPILPEPGGVAADPKSLHWAATQGRNEIHVFEGQEPVTTLRLPAGKSHYRNGRLSFSPAGSLCVAVRDSQEVTGEPWFLMYDIEEDEIRSLFPWDKETMNDFVVGPRMFWERNAPNTYQGRF